MRSFGARAGRIVAMAFAVAVGALPLGARAQQVEDQSYRAGIGLLNKGLSDLAAVEFRKYLEEQPEGPQATNARYSLAVCLTRMRKHAEALPLLERVVKEDGFEFGADARLLLAQCMLDGGDDERAIAVLREVAAKHAEFKQLDRVTVLLGEALYRSGAFEEAVRTLGGVAGKWPKSAVLPRAELFTAMAESAVGEHARAAERAARLRAGEPAGEYALHAALIEGRSRQQLRQLPEAAKLFEIAGAAKDQVRVEALLGLASVSRAQGDLAKAERALADAEKAPVPEGLRDWWTLERGKLLFAQGDAAGGVRVFRDARKSADLNVQAEAAYWGAKCQAKQGKHAEAAANLEAAAERYGQSPLVPDILFERAAALSQGGDDGAAFAAWAQWRQRFPRHELAVDAVLAQAWAAHRLGRFDDSAQLVRELGRASPERTGVESAELLVAENAFAKNEYEAALGAYTRLVERHPKSVHAWRAKARRVLCLVQLGRVDDAAGSLTEALKVGEGQDAGLRRAAIGAVADQYFGKGNWVAAEAWFAKLAREPSQGEELLDARLRHALAVVRQARFADAVILLDRVIVEAGAEPQGRQARFERGQCLLQLGKLDDARAALEEVAAGGDDSLSAHAKRHLATIASRQGRHEEAATILAGISAGGEGAVAGGSKVDLGAAYVAAGRYEEAVKALSAHLEASDPKEAAKATALLGVAMNRVGRHEEALETLRASQAAKDLDAETRASATYELALALRSLGKESEAADVLRGFEKEAPARLASFVRLDLAQVEIKGGQFEAALGLIDRCLKGAEALATGDAAGVRERATYLRGSCLLQLGRAKEAGETLAGFAEAFPKSAILAHAQLVRGEALLASGSPREAAAEFARAAHSDNAELRAGAQLRQGDAWAACQDWTKSEQAFTAFLDRSPGSPLWYQARFGQGWARENQGRHEPAMEAYREVVAKHDGATAARAQFQIGECLYAQKKLDAAIAEFLKTDVLYAYPEWSAAALYEAGRCLEESGRGDDAGKQFDDLIKRFPETRWAKLAAERKQASAPAAVPGRGSPTSQAAPTANKPVSVDNSRR